MATELFCTKRVVCDKEHQYWLDRTTPFPGMREDVADRYRICNPYYDEEIVNKDHIGEDQFISYYPYSRILSWCGWSMRAYDETNGFICKSKSSSKSRLAKELAGFKNCDPSIILDHFDGNSIWYWDCYDAGYSDRTCLETIYNPKTGKSTYFPIEEVA